MTKSQKHISDNYVSERNNKCKSFWSIISTIKQFEVHIMNQKDALILHSINVTDVLPNGK